MLIDCFSTDPNAPKRGLSAYMFFANEQRDNVRNENPGIAFGELRPSPARQTRSHTCVHVCTSLTTVATDRTGWQGPWRTLEGPLREAARPLRGQGCCRQEALRGREGRLRGKCRVAESSIVRMENNTNPHSQAAGDEDEEEE